MKKNLKRVLISLFIFLLIALSFFLVGTPPQAKEISWGVNFSQKHATALGLDWRENYLALIDDLKIKNINLATHWDVIEPQKNQFYFQDLDWQIEKAEEKGTKLILVIGMKTPRWPECHIPDWAKNLSKQAQQEEILEMLKKLVLRYKDSPAIKYWQVENEPLFPFGECPWRDAGFLKKEIKLVKSLDEPRQIIISDSGEASFWIQAARLGDMVGTTMYKRVWFHQLGFYVRYVFPPVFYWRRAQIVKKLFAKDVICIELQAEPWGPKLLYGLPLKEQEKTMNLTQFKANVDFATKTGLSEFYLWGAEWWYWMKEKQNKPEIWNEAKNLFI